MQNITLLLNPVKIKVLTLDTGLLKIIDSHFKYIDPKIRFSPKTMKLVQRGIIDNCRHLFSLKTQTLPIGFINDLKDLLEQHNCTTSIEDLRTYPEINIPDNYDSLLKDLDWHKIGFDGPVSFRYYQKECFDEILKNKKYNGVVEGATAFGKTFVFLALTRFIKGKILIIFPGKQLVFQTKKAAMQLKFDDIGLISGSSQILNKRVMLVNYQSIEKLEDFKTYQTVFVDEMHTAKADTLYSFMKKIPATIRIGFSGSPYTPFKSDALMNALNKANFGEIIYSKKAKALIDEGFLAKTTIYFTKIDFPKRKWYLSHDQAVEELIINGEYRNKIIKKIALMDNKITLILIVRREHGEILQSMIKGSSYVNGDTDIETREMVRETFDKGHIRIVISTICWNQGIDIPNLERIIISGSGKSFYQTIQRIGRGLRKTKFKQDLIINDFIDDTNYYLKEWSKKRWKIYKTEEYPIEILKISEILGKNKDNIKED